MRTLLRLAMKRLNHRVVPMHKLKPCIFCESDEVRIDHFIDGDHVAYYYVFCCNCACQGPAGECEVSAIKDWNTRTNAKLLEWIEKNQYSDDYGDLHINLGELLAAINSNEV